MRICFISHSGGLGGAETVLLETVEILHENGAECRVILPAAGEFSCRLSNLGIPFVILPVPWSVTWKKASLLSQVKAARRIAIATARTARQIWLWKCDIVYSNTITVCTGAFAAAILRLPHIWHIEEFGYEDHGLIFYFGEGPSAKLMGYLSSSCIVLSQTLKAKFSAYIAPSKIFSIYPSMHIATSKTTKMQFCSGDSVFRCVIVGHLGHSKRQEDAVKAIGLLVEAGIDIELQIVGDGDPVYREWLKQVISDKGLDARVLFVGQVPDASPYIAASNVLLMCSRCEAFGRVTIEGMLAGKPVIGTRSGTTPELIQDQVNGRLYDVGNSVELAERIRELFERPDDCERLGRNGKLWAEALFTKDRYLKEMRFVLDSLQRRPKGHDLIFSNSSVAVGDDVSPNRAANPTPSGTAK